MSFHKSFNTWTNCIGHSHPEFKDRAALNTSRIIKWVINFPNEISSKREVREILHELQKKKSYEKILIFQNIWKYAFLKKEKGTKLKASGLPVVDILLKLQPTFITERLKTDLKDVIYEFHNGCLQCLTYSVFQIYAFFRLTTWNIASKLMCKKLKYIPLIIVYKVKQIINSQNSETSKI